MGDFSGRDWKEGMLNMMEGGKRQRKMQCKMSKEKCTHITYNKET